MTELTPAEAQEIEATDGYVAAELCGVTLHVKPAGQWRPSYLKSLREGDYEGWAYDVMTAEDAAKFVEINATFDEINEFTTAAMNGSGETPGKSGGRSRSSRTTRKR